MAPACNLYYNALSLGFRRWTYSTNIARNTCSFRKSPHPLVMGPRTTIDDAYTTIQTIFTVVLIVKTSDAHPKIPIIFLDHALYINDIL